MGINHPVPDAQSIWLFRDKLSAGGMVDKLFSLLYKQLDKDGIIVHKGKLVDASRLEVPIQRNTRDENKELKEGNIPEEWDENKLRRKIPMCNGLPIMARIILDIITISKLRVRPN